MALRQSRRAIVVSTMTYEKLKAFCEVSGVSMSSVVEQRISQYLDEQPENLLQEVEVVVTPCNEAVATEMYRRARQVEP